MSPRQLWDSPTPSLPSECACAPPPGTKAGAHSPAGEGLGESQFRRLEKSLAVCLLCVLNYFFMLLFIVGRMHTHHIVFNALDVVDGAESQLHVSLVYAESYRVTGLKTVREIV
jgi:hypothetical protein